MSEDIEITISVPRDRQADFYKMFGAWLDGQEQSTEAKGWKTGSPWTAHDRAEAAAFRRLISPTACRILDLWSMRAGEWTTGDETAAVAGLKGPRGVAGSLSSVGKAASKLSKQLPFEYEAGEPGGSGRYRMSALVSELFRQASEETNR